MPASLKTVDEIHRQSKNVQVFLEDVLELLRYLLIRSTSSAQASQPAPLAVPKEELDKLCALCARTTVGQLMRCAAAFEDLQGRLSRYASNKRTLLSLTVIRLCDPRLANDTSALEARITELERKLAALSVTPVQTAAPASVPPPPTSEPPASPSALAPAPQPEEKAELFSLCRACWRRCRDTRICIPFFPSHASSCRAGS